MEECESLDPEMTDLQEFSETISQDDEDEVEELRNSLREVVQDPSVKPKLQCLMVDPSFSMVTVQSEDSGIVWETASSRCSTPWASETSSISEGYSMEGSGAAGKITIVFDEDKVIRRRTRSGRSSRLGDRLSRPGSSRSASALGVERPEMFEVSLPNVKQEKTETVADLEEIRNKDQQLFSLISEGYEILNIRVPSKLPTVDEEESTDLQDNLSYLDQTPKIRSRNHQEWTLLQDHVQLEEEETPDNQEASAVPEPGSTSTQRESAGDIDYFEKFTLLDVAAPGEQTELQEEEAPQPHVEPKAEEQKPAKKTTTDAPPAPEESFVFVTDEEIIGEHLDQVFYGGTPADAQQRKDNEEADGGARMRTRRESQRSTKESGSVLFGSEETTLTPIYISAGPPKIIDLILLEEPTAMSFMYTDLYEDAVGQRAKSDEEHSEAESVTSEKSYKRRLSDSDEADGYLEKFTLKDETPAVEVRPQSVEDKREGRMMWSQSRFEMTGCLTRTEGVEEDDKAKAEKPKTQEAKDGDRSNNIPSASFEKKSGIEKSALVKAAALTQEEEEEVFTLAEPSAEISVSKDTIAAEEDPTVEVITDFDCVVRAIMEVTKNAANKKESQTQVQIDLQDLTSTETTAEETANEESEVTPDSSGEATEPGLMRGEVKTDSDKTCHDILESPQRRPEESVTGRELDKTKPMSEAQTSDELVVLVPSGQAVEMDIGVCQLPEKTTDDAEVVPKPETEDATAPTEETKTESPREIQPEAAVDELIRNDIDRKSTPPVPLEEPETVEKKTEGLKEDVGVYPPLKSFTPQESQLEIQPEVAAKVDEPIRNDFDRKYIPPAPLEEPETEKTEDLKDVGVLPPMKSFTPQESPLEIQPEVAVKVDERIRTDLDRKYIPPAPPVPLEEPDTKEKKTDDLQEGVGVLTPQQSRLEIQPEVAVKVDEPIRKDFDRKYTPPTPPTSLDKQDTKQKKTEEDLKEGVGVVSPLKSFTPQESLLEIQPEVAVKVDELIRNDLDRKYIPPAPVEEPETEERKMEEEEEGVGVVSRLRSFTPLEDLSGLHGKEELSEDAGVGEKVEMKKVEDASEAVVIAEDVGPGIDLHTVDVGKKTEQHEMVAEVSETPVEELGYEVISKQDAEETPESGLQRDEDESKPESGQERREGLDVETEMEEKAFDLSPEEEELIEADYDIIDAEEESQARLAAELQGMDWFCLTCGCLLSEDDRGSGKHRDHELTTVDKAYEDIKEKLSDWISELQGRSENIEDLVSELELAYNTVEDQFMESEAVIQAQNEEMVTLVMEQYNNMSISMEEEKKSKLERLYDQIVSFQESIDTTKTTLETTAREAETDARSPEDIHTRLKAALDSAMSLELGPKGLLVFEDYAKGNASGSHLAQRKGIPVPQRPTLQPQEPGSASSTSVTVYWNVNAGDIIDCFQVYCMEDPQGAVSEEYRVTVKESYCVLEELEPDKTYKVWVMAVNYTGCSLPSERLAFRTAPSVPVIDTERCTVLWDSATLRWQRQVPGLTFTLEYCRQYELEGEGLRSISGIEGCEQKVLLQPNENYLFYIKAVNEAGASEQSEAALISTKGTRFHLLKDSAHPALELSVDHTTLHFHQDAHEKTSVADKQCPSILGELLPARGRHYWETIVSGRAAYRLGVTYSSAATRDRSLGGNSQSWCLQCIPTPSGCSYQLLHNDVQTSVFAIEMPERVGTLLDYQLGHLSFFNAQSGQLLGSFSQHFTQPCHPAVALEMPGSLEVCMVQEVPEFTRNS